ncbi:GerAB/ArcD/ProY family transporter [Paenibacillus mendelii]|uniref:Endospore germination permease n=1 Tax=Paenibacillus mendelii TaxID=206163 RepID=A0ABV6J8F7_9BACL|nr:endospore germination permease [Paenibacillus mendelii]MCQ6559508.1 endospore germination permease [Paenibacillus mendelii]
MLDNVKISIQQMAVLVIFLTIGDSVLVLPSVIAATSKQDAWISGIIGIAAGMLIAYIILSQYRLNPRASQIELNLKVLGKWIGWPVSLLFLLYYLLMTTAIIREVGNFMTTQMMPETPIWSIHALLLLILVSSVRSGLEPIARTGEIFLPMFILFFAALIILNLPEVKLIHLKPYLGEGIIPPIQGSIYLAAFSFSELIALAMVLPSVRPGKHLSRDFLLAALFGGFSILAVIFGTILVLGQYITAHQYYPAYALAKKINIGQFLERVEAMFAVIWIISTYFKCTIYFYALNAGTTQLFKLRDNRALTLPLGIVLFGTAYAISPSEIYYSDAIKKYWPFMDLTFSMVFPLALIAVYSLRKLAKG